MTNWATARPDPDDLRKRMRERILGGAKPLLDNLGKDELAAAHDMIARGEAEIICHACRMFLVAKADEPGGPVDVLTDALRKFRRTI